MKLIRDFLIILILLFSGVILTFFIYQKQQKELDLVSPVLKKIKLSFADNVWLPKEVLGASESANLKYNLSASSVFFIDGQTGQVLFSQKPHEKMRIASLTKIMTAIITMENSSLDSYYLISERASKMEPDSMLLKTGERLSVEQLLDGVFLVSGNDAAETLAENVTSRDEFIKLMNLKAKQIGMNDSLFINPTGLEEDNLDQYSTAFDVSVMARYAITRWPQLLEISSQPHIYIPETADHQSYDLYSGINLLTTYPGVVGFKTGYTPEAGLTLVTVAKRSGKEVVGVILGATDRRDDARALLDYSFKKLGV